MRHKVRNMQPIDGISQCDIISTRYGDCRLEVVAACAILSVERVGTQPSDVRKLLCQTMFAT